VSSVTVPEDGPRTNGIVARCECDNVSFILHRNGLIECAACGAILSNLYVYETDRKKEGDA